MLKKNRCFVCLNFNKTGLNEFKNLEFESSKCPLKTKKFVTPDIENCLSGQTLVQPMFLHLEVSLTW